MTLSKALVSEAGEAAKIAAKKELKQLVDLKTWTLLKWLDDPCPYFDWRTKADMHPDDREHFAVRMSEELEAGSTSAVMRLPAVGGGWVPLHVTISRMELDPGIHAGVVAFRQPTEAELDGLDLQAEA